MRTFRTRVKVCGITSAFDAGAAIAAGADAIGVILTDSPRQLTIEQAERVFAAVPPFIARIGVFVDADEAEVAEAVVRLRLSAVQFHGAETAERCAAAPAPVIKALRVGESFSLLESCEPYRGAVAGLLLDTYVPGKAGGTGKTFAWERLGRIPDFVPVIVAGGLNPVNVGAAIRALRPFGVDVSSGVEEHPRAKDPYKLRAFVEAVRAADEEVCDGLAAAN